MTLKLSKNLIQALKKNEDISFSLDKNNSILENIDLSKIKDSETLLRELYKRNTNQMNATRNKLIISEYLASRKNGEKSFLYKETKQNNNFDLDYVSRYSHGGSGGKIISGTFKKRTNKEMANRGYFDYRITIRNSPNITTEEAINFVDTLVREANKRNLNLRMKDLWEADAIILYCDVEDLYNTVKMLEDLTNEKEYGSLVSNATSHFGPVQAFSATISNNSYYGIAMAHSEGSFSNQNGRLVGYYGENPGNTFGGYIEDNILNVSYDILLKKYNGNSDKISVDEMYNEMIKQHKEYMLGDKLSLEDIPLWMNRRNYNDYCLKNKQSNNKMLNNGFYIPLEEDLTRKKYR